MRRRVGSISLAGITGPEELELLEEEAHCESEVFVIFIIFVLFSSKGAMAIGGFRLFKTIYIKMTCMNQRL